MSVSAAEFFSVAVQAAEACGKVIREVGARDDLKEKWKSGGEGPVTMADLCGQKTIEEVLRAKFPGLRIVGEEAQDKIDKYEPRLDPKDVNPGFIPESLLHSHFQSRKQFLASCIEHGLCLESEVDFSADGGRAFDIDKAVVWIDPLDGTRDFVNRNFPAVTVLIGVSVNEHSKFGVVHCPYSHSDPRNKGETYFGSLEHGLYLLPQDPLSTNEQLMEREPAYIEPRGIDEVIGPEQILKQASSLNHFPKESEQFTKHMEKTVQIVKLGGAGNKIVKILKREVDLYCYPFKGLSNWDICAPEALIKASGGYGTDSKFERLRFTTDEKRVIPGALHAGSKGIYDEYVRRLGPRLIQLMKSVR